MFKHIVCFKFKDKAEAAIVKGKLEALQGKVETLRSMEVGLDTLHTERSYDLILITTFDDEAGYRVYDTHPEHQIVRDYIGQVREASCAVDYCL